MKFFADGVVENETGALLAPYCSGLHSHGGDNLGMRNWEGDSLAEAARRVDELGLQIHIHAIGDAAVRQALDAIEYVVAHNGPRDRRPVIAHGQLVDEADIGRFAALGVIPNMQPLWAQLDALMTVLTMPRLGVERADKQYPIRTLDALRGAAGASGRTGRCPRAHRWTASRWRCRGAPPTGDPEGGWTPHEILPIERRAERLHRRRGAPGLRRATGAASRRAPAPIWCWLDRDPRAHVRSELPGIGVRATYLAVQPVYRADELKGRP